jgi:hypothetical protein
MAHFVKWRGAFLDQGSPSISHTIQATEVGKAGLKADQPAVTGWAKPFTTVVYEIGDTLSLHHSCAAATRCGRTTRRPGRSPLPPGSTPAGAGTA